MSISSENTRKVPHPIQIDTTHFRLKSCGNPDSQSQDRSVNRTAVRLHGEKYQIVGPRQAGADVQLQNVLPKFEKTIPADFLIIRKSDHVPLVVGFAHYDSDRGGSQEDDRTGGNQDKVEKIMSYAARRRAPLQILFINDGPGLLLGSMWDDYSRLEKDNIVDDELRVMVLTLKMIPERLTESWIENLEHN